MGLMPVNMTAQSSANNMCRDLNEEHAMATRKPTTATATDAPAASDTPPKTKRAPKSATTTTKATTTVARATKRSASPAAAAKPAAVAKSVTKPATPRKSPTRTKAAISASQRANYIEVAAYYIAARRDFAPGDAVADWLAAEGEIDALIASGKLGGR